MTLAGAFVALAPLSAQPVRRSLGEGGTDLDAFMSRVLERRDDNWKKLQQYVLEERETIQITGPGARPIYGSQREYAWFPRNGIFIKSPLRSDGVTVGESDRRKFEDSYEKLLERREKRRAARAGDAADTGTTPSGGTEPSTGSITEANLREALEPGFVSAAYFMRFTFDPGRYALAGREALEGRQVLRIEYYPTNLFKEGRTKPNKEIRKRDAEVEAKMNKVALVTLWIDPTEHQILKYEFHNLPLDFLPARQIVRVDGFKAAMEMGQPFPNVWLPRAIRMSFDMTLAIGELDGHYAADFYDYKLATVSTKVR
jgi:hypothetical protein